MARPRKAGLDYFPFDVDFFSDEKVVCIAGEFGAKGELTIIKLLCAIYRNGYFTLWNDALKYKLKREIDGASGELLDQIVRSLVRRGFFEESLFNSEAVLTSEGIQRRYFEATKFRQRDRSLPYLLAIPRVNYTKTDISHWETPVSQGLSTQIKRNKIKVSSDEDKKRTSSPPFVEEKFFNEFFGDDPGDSPQCEKRKAAVENLRRSLGFPDLAAMKDAARQALDEWTIRGHAPKDWEDAAAHLISTIRKKCEASPSLLRSRFVEGAKSSTSPRPSLMAELDRQQIERDEQFSQRKRAAAKPADIIRSLGYDPAHVSIAQALNPEWRAANPPSSQSKTNQ